MYSDSIVPVVNTFIEEGKDIFLASTCEGPSHRLLVHYICEYEYCMQELEERFHTIGIVIIHQDKTYHFSYSVRLPVLSITLQTVTEEYQP